jgi:hypothetical protein
VTSGAIAAVAALAGCDGAVGGDATTGGVASGAGGAVAGAGGVGSGGGASAGGSAGAGASAGAGGASAGGGGAAGATGGAAHGGAGGASTTTSAGGAGFVPIPGVHEPLAVAPSVDVPDNHWLLDAYRTVLGREHDPDGYRVNRKALEAGQSRAQIVAAFVASAEFQANPALADRGGFVVRAYQTLLGRAASPAEIASQLADLREASGAGQGRTWAELLASVFGSAEYAAKWCVTGWYTLGGPVKPGALLLGDLFAGRARLATIGESEEVTLTMPSAQAIWDQKLPVLRDPAAPRWIGFSRAFVEPNPGLFDIVLLASDDGLHFTEVGPIFERAAGQTFYDPHVAPDPGVCPPRFTMAMECIGHEGGASLCTSQSTTPGLPETWSAPVVVVDGCTGNPNGVCKTKAAESASTGVTLADGASRYVAWTQVYDGVGANDPQAHTYSQAAAVPSFGAYFGTVMAGTSPIATMLSATPQPWCASPWDCNNRDKQDWKREGDSYYALYNGANYYRCNGTWGVSIARSPVAVGPEYTDRLPLERGIAAERSDTCGISYPVLDVLDGDLFVYYAYYPAAGGNKTMRARLVATP